MVPPSKRWGSNGINYKSCTYFYRAIEKYGWNNFEHIILKDNLTKEQAQQTETQYIKKFNTLVPNGYNLTGGGDYPTLVSETTKKKMRDSHLGYKKSEITKQKMSKSRMGHPGYNCKAIWMCDKKTHKRIKYFPSMTEANIFLDRPKAHSHIGKVCKGERMSAYGYFWEYAEKEE